MTIDDAELNLMRARLSKLENQNRLMQRAAAILLAALVVLAHLSCHANRNSARIVQAEQFVVRDAEGRLRGWFGVADMRDQTIGGLEGGELPLMTVVGGRVAGLLLADQRGRVELAAISTNKEGAVLNILGESQEYTHITGNGVELVNKEGHMAADFKSTPHSFLDLHDSSGEVKWSVDAESR